MAERNKQILHGCCGKKLILHILVILIIRTFGVWLVRHSLVFVLGEHATNQLNESAENEDTLEPDSNGA
jgi:hypothetical protein